MEVKELRTAKEVREKAREVKKRLLAQRKQRAMTVTPVPPLQRTETAPEIAPVRPTVIVKKMSVKMPVHMEHIVQGIVAAAYNITAEHIRGPRRLKHVIQARHIAVWISRQLQGGKLSSTTISRRFGNRDHTTILNSIHRVDAERAKSAEFAEKVDALLNECRQADRRPTAVTVDELLKDANAVLRSVCSVCERKGSQTNWETLTAEVKRVLAEQHHYLHAEQRESDLPMSQRLR